MSASDNNSAIFLTDTPEEIENKINVHAFSGAQATREEQEKYGANCEVDVSYQYLKFFLDDDEKLAEIHRDYSSGKLMCEDVKKTLIEVLQGVVAKHQTNKAEVNDEVLDRFFSFERRPCADDFTAPQPKAAAAGGGGKKKKGKKTKKSNQENKPAAPEAVVAMDPAS